ncbi:uncharacterized protein LOC135469733 isoform X2 [Liolophura sinensis]|uniref:uncharacterized protein LOC135469733 isoform X2 n=1 Tax=Liolophura sinensis TaxID=3198878 RepID=UPI0031587B1F
MNWVGGARSRIKREKEWKTQKEFFQRKRFLAKQNKISHQRPKNPGRRSQDLKALMALDKTFSAKHSATYTNDHSRLNLYEQSSRGHQSERQINRLNLNKFQQKRRFTEVHLPASSPTDMGPSLTVMNNIYSEKKPNRLLQNKNVLTRTSKQILPRLGKNHLFSYETTPPEEFFQRKRFLAKQNKISHQRPKNPGRRSQDLKALMALDKTFSAKHSATYTNDHSRLNLYEQSSRGHQSERQINRLNLNKFQQKRRFTEVHLPASSPTDMGPSLTVMNNICSEKKPNRLLQNKNVLTRTSKQILPRLGKNHLFSYETTPPDEFFQRKRFLAKQNKISHQRPKNPGRRNQDLKALMAVDKTFSAKHSATYANDHSRLNLYEQSSRGHQSERQINRLNLNKFQQKRRFTEVHLPASSPTDMGPSLTVMNNIYSEKKPNRLLQNKNVLTRTSKQILPRLGKNHLFSYETTPPEVQTPLPSWPQDELSKFRTPLSDIHRNFEDHKLETIVSSALLESKVKPKISNLEHFQTTPLKKCYSNDNQSPAFGCREEDNQIVPFSSQVDLATGIEVPKTIKRGIIDKHGALKGKIGRGKFCVRFSDQTMTNDSTFGWSSKLETKNLERPSLVKTEKSVKQNLFAGMFNRCNNSPFRFPEKEHRRDQEISKNHTQPNVFSTTFYPKFKKEFHNGDQIFFCNTGVTNCSSSANISWELNNDKQIRDRPETEEFLTLQEGKHLPSSSLDGWSVIDCCRPRKSNSTTPDSVFKGPSGQDKFIKEELPINLDTSCLIEERNFLKKHVSSSNIEDGDISHPSQNSSPHLVPNLSAPCATVDYFDYDQKERKLHKFDTEMSFLQTYDRFKAPLTESIETSRDEATLQDESSESLKKHHQEEKGFLDMDIDVTYAVNSGGVHTGGKTLPELADKELSCPANQAKTSGVSNDEVDHYNLQSSQCSSVSDVTENFFSQDSFETCNSLHDVTVDVSTKSTEKEPFENAPGHDSEEVAVISASTQTDNLHCDAHTSCDLDFRHMSTQWDPLDLMSPPCPSTLNQSHCVTPNQSRCVTTKPCVVKVEIMEISTSTGSHDDADLNKNIYSLRRRCKKELT